MFPTLKGTLRTDAVVIGGGLAGILTAHLLQQEGVRVIVLEADRIGGGQTSGTTAKLTAQHGLKYHTLQQTLGADPAAQYAKANLTAVEHLRHLIETLGIDCALQRCTTFLYALGESATLKQEYDACSKLGMDVFLTKDTELPFTALALGLRNQALFHPLKLLQALSDDLQIFENSRVLEVDDHTVRTKDGAVTAEKIIFTCHYPFLNFPGLFFLRQHQERSYVITLEGTAAFRDAYLGIDGPKFSFRPCGELLLLGGGGHRTGENPEGGKYEHLIAAAQTYWPKCRMVSKWSAQDTIPMDGIPFIGSFSRCHPDWLVASGFQKWGMSSSMLAAEILRNAVLGTPMLPEHTLFSPHRFHMKASSKQLAEDTLHSIRGLSRRFLEPGHIPAEKLPPGHGAIVKIDGEKLGVYRDETGKLHAVSVKCPHLGCQVEWNPDEKSWDCPCHGSRFDIDGRLLNGPAQKDLSSPKTP